MIVLFTFQGLLSVNMVEKIREAYQKHSRNISTVSDISVSLAEPLKRDENAEIRCILLCDSETERNCVFEALSKALVRTRPTAVTGSELTFIHRLTVSRPLQRYKSCSIIGSNLMSTVKAVIADFASESLLRLP